MTGRRRMKEVCFLWNDRAIPQKMKRSSFRSRSRCAVDHDALFAFKSCQKSFFVESVINGHVKKKVPRNKKMIRRAEIKDVNAVFGLAKELATSTVMEETAFRASFFVVF